MPHPHHPARVTIMDIARAADVSRQTVSNVVNRPERVHEVTRDRVQAVIDRLGYQPSVAAQSLRARRAGAIGLELNVMGEDSINDVAHPFLVELTIAAPGHHCHIVPFASRGVTSLVDGYQRLIGTNLVDAFVLADAHVGDPRPGLLQAADVPFVSFGRLWDDPSFTAWADVDGAAGTAAATEHCAGQGYTAVGFLGWPAGSAIGQDRHDGWTRTLDRIALAGRDADEHSPQDADAALAAGRRLVDRLGPGAAVVCASDVLAFGVLRAVRESGLTPGRDFGVVGFDDSGTSRLLGLTTVVQPLRPLADHLLGVVQDLLETGRTPSAGTLFSPSLAVRDSTTRSA